MSMNMEIVELKAKIKFLIRSMFIEDILDGQFKRVEALQDEISPNFAIDVLGLYCSDLETMIVDFDKHMVQQNVDYEKLREYAHKLIGSSACIGACRMKMPSAELLQATRDKNKQGCEQAVKRIVAAYLPLRTEYLKLFKIHERILEIETSQRQETSNKQSSHVRFKDQRM